MVRPNQNNRQPPPQLPSRSPHPSDSPMRNNDRFRQPPSHSPSPRTPPDSAVRSNDQPRQPPPPETPPRGHEPEPTFPMYPPYIMQPPPPRRRRSGSSSCASCILATVFLLIVVAIAIAACFVLFKPQDPKIAVNSVRFPAFSISNGNANFTIFQYVSVRNPNRYSFSHYDSSMQLFYFGSRLGFMFIPAGEIAPGRTQYVSATFNVTLLPVINQPSATTAVSGGGAMFGPNPAPTMEVETRVKMVGRVRVLVLSHHVETTVKCRVTIVVSSGQVLGFHC